jgi:hypothetical protein
MEKEYKTKDLKAEKVVKEEKLDLPIYEKRGNWCFKLKGGLYKFPTKELATEKYLELK